MGPLAPAHSWWHLLPLCPFFFGSEHTRVLWHVTGSPFAWWPERGQWGGLGHRCPRLLQGEGGGRPGTGECSREHQDVSMAASSGPA